MPRAHKNKLSAAAKAARKRDASPNTGLVSTEEVQDTPHSSSSPAVAAASDRQYHAASLCSSSDFSSSSSEVYVSPRESEHGDVDHVARDSSKRSAESPLCRESTLNNPIGSEDKGRQLMDSTGDGAKAYEQNCMNRTHQHNPAAWSSATPPDLAHSSPHGGTSNSKNSEAVFSSPPPPPLPRTHFQYIHSFDYRCRLAAKMRALYGASTIPVIVEPAESHLRTALPASSNGLLLPQQQQQIPYASQRMAAEARRRSAGLGQSVLACLGVPGTSPARGSSVRGGSVSGSNGSSTNSHINSSGSTTQGTSPALSAAAVAALSSPSTRSTLKCVLPASKSVAEVILTLRDRLALDSCQSIFLSVGESDALVPGNSLLGDLYQRYRNRDGFLYLSYLLENTFG